MGAKGSVDKNAFFDKTMPALINEMDAARKTVLARIQPQLSSSIANYDLGAARVDLEDYYSAGTLIGAISGIVESSGQKSATANSLLISSRNKSFFSEAVQAQGTALIDQIDKLSSEKAIEIEANVPTTSPEIERLVASRDRLSKRASSGDVAKEILKMRVVYIDRDEKSLKAWAAAIKAALASQ